MKSKFLLMKRLRSRSGGGRMGDGGGMVLVHLRLDGNEDGEGDDEEGIAVDPINWTLF